MKDIDSDSSGDEEANFREVCYGSVSHRKFERACIRGSTDSVSSSTSTESASPSVAVNPRRRGFPTRQFGNACQYRGQIKLVACGTPRKLTVTLLEVRNLLSSVGCYVYIKVSLSSDKEGEDAAQTIRTYMSSKEVILHETVSFNLSPSFLNKRLLIEVWSDVVSPSNFKGCTSFGLRKFMANCEIIQGSYYLLGEGVGRRKHLSVKPAMNGRDTAKERDESENVQESSSTDISTPRRPERRKLLQNVEVQISIATLAKNVVFGRDEDSPPMVAAVAEGSHSGGCNLRKNDVIKSLNGRTALHLTNFEFQNILRGCRGHILLQVQRASRHRTAGHLTPRSGSKRKLHKRGPRSMKKRRLNPQRTVSKNVASKANGRTFSTTLNPYKLAYRAHAWSAHGYQQSSENLLPDVSGDVDDDVFLPETPCTPRGVPAILSPLVGRNCELGINAPGTPMCMASLCYGFDAKSAKIVRRKSYCSDRRLLTATTCESPLQRCSTLRSSLSGDARKRHENMYLCGKFDDVKGDKRRSCYYPMRSQDLSSILATKSSQNQLALHQSEDSIDILSVASSSDGESKLGKARESESDDNSACKIESRSVESPAKKEGVQDRKEHEKPKRLFFMMTKKTKKNDNRYSTLEASNVSTSSQTSQNSLLAVLNSKGKCAAFRAFLAKEHSEENLDFWTECENYKSKKATKQRKLALVIYKKFIESNSECEVNINAKIRTLIQENLQDPSPQIFSEAQDYIYRLMESDSFRRYSSQNIASK